jgi:hypothetical protein
MLDNPDVLNLKAYIFGLMRDTNEGDIAMVLEY